MMDAIKAFLKTTTPQAWIDLLFHEDNISILLIDHALCEKKAASSAISLMHRYPECDALLKKMSRLAREELKHFEMVLNILKARKIKYQNLPPSEYVKTMREHIRSHQPARLVDELIVGAIIEARSCERFSALLPYLDQELAHFYSSLLNSESRHFQDYLALANLYSDENISARVDLLTKIEANYIQSKDQVFRFHSGV